MGAAIGTDHDSKARNVELNIVPFIDLMSCLTAFLLVTAVWVNIAKLDTHVAGKTREGIDSPEDPELAVLVESDDVWIGVSRVNEFQRIPNTPTGYDWNAVAVALRAHKVSGLFATTDRIQIAGASANDRRVSYQALVAAMDVAVRAGFVDVGITDPAGLATRPL